MAASEELARRVVEAGRSCSLTTAVLEEWSRLGTPKQVEYLAGYLEAERSSREASKRATLLRRCALPAPKTFDGYDWSAVSWPEGMGRESLLALDVSVNLFFTSFAKQARRSRKGGFTGCANVFSPIPVTA